MVIVAERSASELLGSVTTVSRFQCFCWDCNHVESLDSIACDDYCLKAAMQDAWFFVRVKHRFGSNESHPGLKINQSPHVWTRMIDNRRWIRGINGHWQLDKSKSSATKGKEGTLWTRVDHCAKRHFLSRNSLCRKQTGCDDHRHRCCWLEHNVGLWYTVKEPSWASKSSLATMKFTGFNIVEIHSCGTQLWFHWGCY